jgi:hypothetical protein
MIAPYRIQKYGLTVYENAIPYNFADYSNGWPDSIGVPSYLVSDLGGSLRSRFSLPSSPWYGDSIDILEILIARPGATITWIEQINYDPPEGYRFIGPEISPTPPRTWDAEGYQYIAVYGPLQWDYYRYQASGVYIVPTYRTLLKNGTGIGIAPLIGIIICFLLPLLFSSSGGAVISGSIGQRKRRVKT